nr:hypothetical protein [Paracoccus saliphilus]
MMRLVRFSRSASTSAQTMLKKKSRFSSRLNITVTIPCSHSSSLKNGVRRKCSRGSISSACIMRLNGRISAESIQKCLPRRLPEQGGIDMVDQVAYLLRLVWRMHLWHSVSSLYLSYPVRGIPAPLLRQ